MDYSKTVSGKTDLTVEFLTAVFESRIALVKKSGLTNDGYEYQYAERHLRTIAVDYLELPLDEERINKLVKG